MSSLWGVILKITWEMGVRNLIMAVPPAAVQESMQLRAVFDGVCLSLC